MNYCGKKENSEEIILFQDRKVSIKSLESHRKSPKENQNENAKQLMVIKLQRSWKAIKLKLKREQWLKSYQNIINLISMNVEVHGTFLTNQEFLNLMPEKIFKTYSKFYGKEPLDMNFAPLNTYRLRRKPLKLYNDKNILNKHIYKGQWLPTGERDGFGALLAKDFLLQGFWRKNVIYYGMKIFANGCYYIGDIDEYNADGDGKYYSKDYELIYEGSWSNDKYYGTGKLRVNFPNINIADFKNEDFQSSDFFINLDIKKIKKKKSKNKKTLEQNNTIKIENNKLLDIYFLGEFEDNQINGKGKLGFPNYFFYEGEFSNGKINGTGILKIYYKDPNNPDQLLSDEYNGEFKDSKMEGRGIYLFSSGNYYEGFYKENRRNGFGTFYFNDGVSFETSWTNSKPNGKGVFFNKDRTQSNQAIWRMGILVFKDLKMDFDNMKINVENNATTENKNIEILKHSLPKEYERIIPEDNFCFIYDYPNKDL